MGWLLLWDMTEQTIFCFAVPSQMLFAGFVWLLFCLPVCFILLCFVLFRQQGWRTMLNQAVSFLNSSLWAQTDKVHVVLICRHVLSVATLSNEQKERRNIYAEKILLEAGTCVSAAQIYRKHNGLCYSPALQARKC